ncbi:MAG: tripartite tricarboxylate transporter TctB family protein [Arthrobacter sp.]|uniref:tripartite tricarboxylate transporter TctB family protein n=1 Tax=Arthrobacter sp. TaxID=1667 RepID=UPI003470D84F
MNQTRDTDGASGAAPDSLEEELTPEQLAERWEAEGPPPAGAVANLASSLIAAAVGAAGMALAVSFGLGSPAQPGPGMWPFAVSVVIVVFGVVQVIVGRRGGEGEKFTRLSWLAAIGLATLVGLLLLMPVIGFEIPSLLLCLIWMKFLGGETWRSAVLYSVLVVAGFYGIFILALGTSIPHLI